MSVVDLTNTRAIAAGAMLAYATEQLQAVKNLNAGREGVKCTYTGPCAIGISIDPETREKWDYRDDGQAIVTIIEDGWAIGTGRDLQAMQSAHDHFARHPRDEDAHFGFLITTLFFSMGLHE